MKLIMTPLVVACALALPSCIVVEDNGGVATVPSAGSSESDEGPPGWQAGYEKGMADGQGGLSRTPSRYGYIYSEADHSGFFSGYEAGYNRGIRP